MKKGKKVHTVTIRTKSLGDKSKTYKSVYEVIDGDRYVAIKYMDNFGANIQVWFPHNEILSIVIEDENDEDE